MWKKLTVHVHTNWVRLVLSRQVRWKWDTNNVLVPIFHLVVHSSIVGYLFEGRSICFDEFRSRHNHFFLGFNNFKKKRRRHAHPSPMPTKTWSTPIVLGSSIGMSNKIRNHVDTIITTTSSKLYSAFPSIMQPKPNVNNDSTFTLVRLHNQYCMYHGKGECKRGDDCYYLHNEKPIPCILYGTIELVPTQYRYVKNTENVCKVCVDTPETPETEVPRIFFSGVPSDMSEGWVKEVVSAVGTVVEVTYITSTSMSSSKSGHLVMSSKAEALKAIDRLCAIRFGDTPLKACVDKKQPKKILAPCFYFAKGKCRFGDQCTHLHEMQSKPSAPRVGGHNLPSEVPNVCSPVTTKTTSSRARSSTKMGLRSVPIKGERRQPRCSMYSPGALWSRSSRTTYRIRKRSPQHLLRTRSR